MSNPNLSEQQAIERERSEILQQLEDWLDVPMLILSFVWLALFIVELIWGINPFLDALGITIWLLFILDFGIEFLLAPRKAIYLRRNWLTALSLFLPALRTLRIIRFLRALRTVRAVRGLQLLRVLSRANRGMYALAASVSRRGFGYAVMLTILVTLIGAAGMYAFERQVSAESGLNDYGSALWWTAMVMTTIGPDYIPKTAEGRMLYLVLALYAFAVFGYVTATLATFFVGQDAEDEQAEIAGTRSMRALQAEIAALRAEIRALSSKAPER